MTKYGWGFMDKYMANKPNYIQGHLPVARSVASRARTTRPSTPPRPLWRLKRDGQPIDVYFSPEDETPVFTVTAGIFKGAPHRSAAKLYLTWYLAKEQQSRTGTFSSRADVPPPNGLKPLTVLPARQPLSRIHDRREDGRRIAQAIRDLHRSPVTNRGGVR